MKRQTLTLVLIGVILFIAGSAIAFASVKGASKHAGSNSNGAPISISAVVASGNIPAGTTGQSMISSHLVGIELIPSKSFKPIDLQTLDGLTNEVATQSIAKGQAVNATELSASTSSISIPTGMDAMTVAMTGTNALAGYLQPGSRVDVYANITKLSIGDNANLPVPCTELAMSNIQVLDVSSTAPSYAGHRTAAGRTLPSGETVLLAVTGQQAQTLQFLEQNESLSIVQPSQQGATPPPLMQCVGTGQTTGAP